MIRRLLLFVAAVVVTLLSLAPDAQAYPATSTPPPSGSCTVAPCFEYRSTTNYADVTPTDPPWNADPTAACVTWFAFMDTFNPNVAPYAFTNLVPSGSSYACNGTAQGGAITGVKSGVMATQSVAPATATLSCPNGGTLSGTSCTCPAGQTDNGSACSESPCSTDTVTSLNPTTGWGWITGFSSDGRAIVKAAPGRISGDGNTPPSPVCDGTCVMQPEGAPDDYLIAKDPSSTGLYRISILQKYRNSGATCSAQTPDLDGSLTASCPGTMGTVNGKTVCLSGAPSTSTGSADGSKDVGDRTISNTPTGSTGGGTGTTPDKMGPNGEMGTAPGDVKNGTAGGSTSGTGGGTRSSTGTTITTSTPDGTSTFTYGDMTSNKTPGVPTLYERKYDKDPGDYLLSKVNGFSTAAGSFVSAAFVPPWGDGAGSCPKFTLELGTIGPWVLGGGDVSVPCEVWAFCRIIIIISALFLARSLIFGG